MTDPDSGEPALMWVRVWRGVRDAVIAASARSALAYRVWEEDFDSRTPFVVEDDLTLWRSNGPFLEVTEELLALKTPGESHFPSRSSTDPQT